MAKADAVLRYHEDGKTIMQPMRIEYFLNSKMVNDFNQTGILNGARAEVEVIAKGVNFENAIEPHNNPHLSFNDIWWKVLQTTPVSGAAGKVTTFMAVRTIGEPS